MRIRDASFSLSVTVLGVQLEACFIPFRWARPAYRGPRSSLDRSPWSHHVLIGPFHVWTMSGLSATLGVELNVGQDPFHGDPLVR